MDSRHHQLLNNPETPTLENQTRTRTTSRRRNLQVIACEIETTMQEENSTTATSLSSSTNIASSSTNDEATNVDNSFENRAKRLEESFFGEADGGDSDEEGEEMEILNESLLSSCYDHQDSDDCRSFSVFDANNHGYLVAKGDIDSLDERSIAQYTNIPKKPSDWICPPKKGGSEEPEMFENVDNPGNWCDYVYRPLYKKEGSGNNASFKYIRHELPTGCSVVPVTNGEHRKREINGWTFHYNGWSSSRKNTAGGRSKFRSGATVSHLFPQSRDSSLDDRLLKKLKMNKQRLSMEKYNGGPDA